ncbi:MAG: sigma 54-interacting transcriptional regulator [Deltaproteobacteria bacterium]|nr:sigma 54-interacting transcriptional regulator [Deltaproteobacteria bacterium]
MRLVVERNGPTGKSLELGTIVRIGKAPDNDLVIDHPTVSRYHCELRRDAERYVLADVGSTNGTFLDGAQVREAFVRPGALIEVGDVLLRLQSEQATVTIAPSSKERFGALVGQSQAMREIFALLERIAPTDATLLLIGETGSGKGALARAIHEQSQRAGKPFVVVDCSAVSPSLIESELFGHERGAFTGAVGQRQGSIEAADGGTLFLDEVDDLALDLQPKLLRALEERVFQRVGSSTPIRFDARVIAASKKDLWQEVADKKFREDLYFRLSVFTVKLPPLRERREDIPALADAFAGGPDGWSSLPPSVRDGFLAHGWPGNVRELRNALERARHLSGLPGGPPAAAVLDARSGQGSPGVARADALSANYDRPFKDAKDELLSAFEKEYLKRLLAKAQGNIAKAAREAELDRKYLYSLLRKYGFSEGQGGEG